MSKEKLPKTKLHQNPGRRKIIVPSLLVIGEGTFIDSSVDLPDTGVINPRGEGKTVINAGVLMQRSSIGNGVHVEEYAEIHTGVQIENKVRIGASAIIGAGTGIGQEAVIGRGAEIGENCVISPRVVVSDGEMIPDRTIVQRDGSRSTTYGS
jgi:UDP-3-O-[3-hydroxymyristoyl] glucosamine N-acyltransferase